MKANKLMIGDWVSLFQGNPNGSSCNVKVSYIGEYGEVGIDGCKEYTSANCNLLFPIPLTAEILEKNFNFDPNNSEGAFEHYWWSNGYFDVAITEFTDGIWEVEVDGIEMSGLTSWHMFVSNLHELQHALRLCGIEKEITI